MRNIATIIVTSSNDLFYTRQCLESIRRHTNFPYEVIVVDNGSQDGTLQYLQTLDWVMVIANKENLYAAKAARQGIEASGDSAYVLLLDSDVVVFKDGWLTDMIGQLESDEKIGAVGPKYAALFYEEDEAAAKLKEYVLDKRWLENLIGPNDISQEELLSLLTQKPPHPYGPSFNELCGWAQLYKREVIEKIGVPITDDAFFEMFFWDSEYSMRALVFGYRLENSPVVNGRNPKLHHFGGRSRLFYKNPLEYIKRVEEDKQFIRKRRCMSLLLDINRASRSINS